MTIQNKKYKIALVCYELSKGGLGKVMSSLSVYFDKIGLEIHNIVLVDDISYPYSGKLLNIGKIKNKGIYDTFKILFYYKNYIEKNEFDYIIDFRYRLSPFKELFFSIFMRNRKTVYTVHSSNLQTYLPNCIYLTKLICANKYSIVCVSNEIKKLVEEKFCIKNSFTIYNPVDFDVIKKLSVQKNEIDFSYIISAGRFDSNNVKQFDKLIKTYSNSILPSRGIKLVILGEGVCRDYLKSVSKESGVEDFVFFLRFKENPYSYFKNAIYFVLCSKYEGFGLVLVESLATDTPVISFDCISGPNEIIIDKENGLLIENQNFEKLKQAMNLFIEDKKIYNHCKKNARNSVSKFSIDKIGKQWLKLMNINIDTSK